MAKHTNEQKFKTAEERVKAFEEFCKSRDCEDCSICKRITKDSECWAHWLALEAEEEKL